jgi:hypothetical protein
MSTSRAWSAYQSTYRAKEMAILAGWIQAGVSGAVVGPAGGGKSNLLGFLGHRPDALRLYLPLDFSPGSVALIPVDLNILPTSDLASLYRVIFRSFNEVRNHFDSSLQQITIDLYQKNWTTSDPFLLQSVLRELLQCFQTQRVRVALILDRFDHFCWQATPQMLDTLRGLRDSFKDTLCFIVGMRREAAYLPDPGILGELYELLDSHMCWAGPMSEEDALQLIVQETQTPLGDNRGIGKQGDTVSVFPSEAEIKHLLALTGNYPALLKAVCQWWRINPNRPAMSEWEATLLVERSIEYRLAEIWASLTQGEQLALAEVEKWHSQSKALPKAARDLETQHREALTRLTAKGLCGRTESGWRIFGDLLAAYIAAAKGRGSGKIWLDERTGELYQGQTLLEGLAPLERAALTFFVKNPGERHTKSILIDKIWPDVFAREGITDDSLYKVIQKLRQRIEPNPTKPSYLITWRGTLEGGYQFFPEGKPG